MKKTSLVLLTIIIFALAATFPATPVYPQTETYIYVEPAVITVGPLEDFVIEIKVANVEDLAAWYWFKILYDPTVLECSFAWEGDFLKSGGPTNFWYQIYPDGGVYCAHACIRAMCELADFPGGGLPPGGGVSGGGTLCKIAFMCLSEQNIELNIDEGLVLWNSNEIAIPFTKASIWPGYPPDVWVYQTPPPHPFLAMYPGYPGSFLVWEGAEFSVDINVHDPIGLVSWGVTISYDPQVIEPINFEEGPYFKNPPFPDAYYMWMFVSGPGEIFGYGAKLEGAAWQPHGTLATITFRAVGRGETDLQFGLTELVDYEGNFIDHGELMGPHVKVVPSGDANGDCRVDIRDGVLIGIAFDSRPGDPRWDPRADLNEDGVVDILDMVIWQISFGEFVC